jgi:catechol 2,3-dioxygenase-like lactoylglutathione lyase family enzyme
MTATLTPKLNLTKVGYLIVYVNDVEKSAAWYKEKLGIPARHVEKGWGELETAGFTLALHGSEKPVAKLPETAPTVVFSVDDVRGAHAALKAAGVAASELHAVCEFDGKVGVSADFADLDGNRLSVYGMLAAADWKK